jgi:RNA polymerase sigma-70 factor (ECF subfamily)
MKRSIEKYDDSQLYESLSKKKDSAEAAFAELYARYSNRIYAYCLRLTGNSEDARDIFQETFIKFYNSCKTTKNFDNVPGYLLTIARNLCINYHRDRKFSTELTDFNLPKHNNLYEQKELMQVLATALELLDIDYREAFILRQYQGLDYEEIAKLTDSTIPAVKNKVWRAKEKLKDILAPYLNDLYKKT